MQTEYVYMCVHVCIYAGVYMCMYMYVHMSCLCYFSHAPSAPFATIAINE